MSTPEDKAADAVEEETTATEVGDYEARIRAETVEADDTEAVAPAEPEPGSRLARVLAFGVLPVLALLLGGAAGYLRYDYPLTPRCRHRGHRVGAGRAGLHHRAAELQAGIGGQRTSPRPATGSPEASWTPTPGWSTPSSSRAPGEESPRWLRCPLRHRCRPNPINAVVLAFVDQTVVVGNDAPTRTASSVRITLEGRRPLADLSGFEPV